MAIQQRLRQSDLEKRLQILHRQVYGNMESGMRSSPQAASNERASGVSNPATYQLPVSKGGATTNSPGDLAYLNHDLIKIITFSSFAIGAEVILYFLLTNHILKINFF